MSSSMPSSSRMVAASSRISACGDGDAAMEMVPSPSSFSAVSPPSSPSEPPPQAASTAANTDMVSSNKNFFIRQNPLPQLFFYMEVSVYPQFWRRNPPQSV